MTVETRLDEMDAHITKQRVRWIRIATAFTEFLICLFVREAVRKLLD